jgi:hypothetical protein
MAADKDRTEDEELSATKEHKDPKEKAEIIEKAKTPKC